MFTGLQDIKHPGKHYLFYADPSYSWFTLPISASVVLLWSHAEFRLSTHHPAYFHTKHIFCNYMRNLTFWYSHTEKEILTGVKAVEHVRIWPVFQDTYCSTFLRSYLWQYGHHLHAVLCLETVQSLVGVKLLWRWGPNTWMAAQYLEFHMLKNENSPLESKINICTIHKFKVSNLRSQSYPILFLLILAHFLLSKEKQSGLWDHQCVCARTCTWTHLCTHVSEPSTIPSFSSTHILYYTSTLLPVPVPIHTTQITQGSNPHVCVEKAEANYSETCLRSPQLRKFPA